MEANCSGLESVLAELDRLAGDSPFLALGQTIFWDEPMKGGLYLESRKAGYSRKLVAGVHDTDYFAKLPSGPRNPGRYKAFPHNDTTTRGLWSAAVEFSALFGSETVVTREMLARHGSALDKLERARPGVLDSATEAWGWRGVVSLDDHPPITAETPLRQLYPELMSCLDWALGEAIDCLRGEGRLAAEALADELRTMVCDAAEDPSITLSEFYMRLLSGMYEFCANASIELTTTSTTELLRFNSQTCDAPRFELANLFVDPATRAAACRAYDEAIQGSSGLYELERFGVGAIPFDLVIPGKGRGTVRLGNRGAVVMTPEPQFLSYKRPLSGIRELAELVERKFGPNCTLVGKAVTLIGMLAREFVFVFHEGASNYVKHSRELHKRLGAQGWAPKLNPILRVRYAAWDSLSVCCSWLRLPEPLRRPFGGEELCAPSFAARWKAVDAEERALLEKLAGLRRPLDLIRFLDSMLGGSWRSLAEEYQALHMEMEQVRRELEEVKQRRRKALDRSRELRRERIEAELAKGRQFRERIFGQEPTPDAVEERKRLTGEVERIVHESTQIQNQLHAMRREQVDIVARDQVQRAHERRRSIEVEAELKRLRLIREAVIASQGLEKANHRPSAWWFRLVCPDGLWFRETARSAEYYLEPLV